MLTVKEIGKLSRRELQARADESFALADEKGPAYLMQAQFYVRELEHRRDSWVSRRDLFLEIVVIILIAGELYMSHRQSIQQDTQFKEQQTVLGNMEKSSKETLGALVAERQTMGAMNTALQKQLGLFYEMSIDVLYDDPKKSINLLNVGHTNITLWGMRFFGGKPLIDGEGRTIVANGGGWEFRIGDQYTFLEKTFPNGQRGELPFELYLKNERGEEFVAHCYLGTMWNKDALSLSSETKSVVPEHWSRSFPIPKKGTAGKP